MSKNKIKFKRIKIKDLKKSLTNLDPKYDNFLIRDSWVISKDCETGQKLEIYINSDYKSKDNYSRVVIKALKNQKECKTISDLINVLKTLDSNEKISNINIDIIDNGFNDIINLNKNLCTGNHIDIYDILKDDDSI